MTARTYKYRLRLTSNQRKRFEEILEAQRLLYNELLEWKTYTWEVFKVGLGGDDIEKWLTHQRRRKPDWSAIPSRIQRSTVDRLERAFQGFFRRVKAGQPAGYPRFRSRDRWDSFGFKEFAGITFAGKSLKIKGVPGRIKLNLHRSLPDNPKFAGATFRRDHKGWYVALQVKIGVPTVPAAAPTSPVGIDVGLTSLATLSNGQKIDNQRHMRRAAQALRRVQRRLSRCRYGSNRRTKVKRAVVCACAKVTNTRDTYLHQISRQLVDTYDLIAVEKLQIKNLAQGRLAGAIHDAAWATFVQMLAYKAEDAGKRVVFVDPRNTSQECSGCGCLVPKDLSVRAHSCPHCGLTLDRDHNAAINILRRAVAGPDRLNAAHERERAGGTPVCSNAS